MFNKRKKEILYNSQDYIYPNISKLYSAEVHEVINSQFDSIKQFQETNPIQTIDLLKNNKKEKIEFALWLNLDFEGLVNFNKPYIIYSVNRRGELECKLIYYFLEINKTKFKGLGTPIPAVSLAFRSLTNFKSFLDEYKIVESFKNNEIEYVYVEAFRTSLFQDRLYFYANVSRINLEYVYTVFNFAYKPFFEKDFVTIINSNKIKEKEELAILSLMDVLAYRLGDIENEEKLKNSLTHFLSQLLNNSFNGKTWFSILYYKINDWKLIGSGKENLTRLINQLYKYWLFSSYNNSELNTFKSFQKSPSSIAYKNKTLLTFIYNEFDFEFINNYAIRVKKVTSSISRHQDLKKGTQLAYVSNYGEYHIFQPLNIVELDNDNNFKEHHAVKIGNLSLPSSTIPAFFLKAIDDKGEWKNFEKSVWLAFDIALTITGVGNLAKLKYLRSLSLLENIRIVLGSIEFSTASIRILLSLSDECEGSAFCQDLKDLLLIMEIGAGTSDLLMSVALKNKAREVLKHRDALEKSLDDLVENGKIKAKGKTKTLEDIEELADWAEFYADNYKQFLKSKGLKIIKAEKATINLKIIDKAGFERWVGKPEDIERFVKFEMISQKSAYIQKHLKQQAATSKAVYKANNSSGVPLSTRGYGTAPDFKSLGSGAYLKNGKLGNGLIPKGFEKDYQKMMQLITKSNGELRTFVSTDYTSDFKNCWRAMGVTDSKQISRLEELRVKLKLTWHHLDDLDANMKSTFQFVDSELHGTTITHLGSNGQADYIYKTLKK